MKVSFNLVKKKKTKILYIQKVKFRISQTIHISKMKFYKSQRFQLKKIVTIKYQNMKVNKRIKKFNARLKRQITNVVRRKEISQIIYVTYIKIMLKKQIFND